MEAKTQPPVGTTHYRFSAFGYDYFYKFEQKDGASIWWSWGLLGAWEHYHLVEHDPDIWPIQCRHNGYACNQLRHALETLMLFTKPTKSNAAALQNALQVLVELNMATSISN